MKYLGQKSLSSAFGVFLHIAWYGVLLGSVFVFLIISDALFFEPITDPAATGIDKIRYEIYDEIRSDEPKDWEEIKGAPAFIKVLVLSYIAGFFALLLFLIQNGRKLFDNFKENVVFSEGNVKLISKISKLLIAYSIISFNFSSLLVGVIVLILSEVFKTGTFLQKEYDLTV